MLSSFSIKHANSEVRKAAKNDVTFISTVGFLPLIIAYLVVVSNKDLVPFSLWTTFVQVFLSGQLYFYAMSICATIALLSSQSSEHGNRGMRQWSFVFVLFCVSFMTVYISQSPATVPSITFHSCFSVLFLIASILLYFRVLVLSNSPAQTPEEVNRNSVKKITNSVDPQYD